MTIKKSLLFLWMLGAWIAAFPADLSPLAAEAESHSLPASVGSACKSDLEQFCKNVTPGEGREEACLAAYNDKISAGCKQAIQANINQWTEFTEKLEAACSSDIEKFCKESPGAAEVIDCLSKHAAELSGTCKSFAEGHPQIPS